VLIQPDLTIPEPDAQLIQPTQSEGLLRLGSLHPHHPPVLATSKSAQLFDQRCLTDAGLTRNHYRTSGVTGQQTL